MLVKCAMAIAHDASTRQIFYARCHPSNLLRSRESSRQKSANENCTASFTIHTGGDDDHEASNTVILFIILVKADFFLPSACKQFYAQPRYSNCCAHSYSVTFPRFKDIPVSRENLIPRCYPLPPVNHPEHPASFLRTKHHMPQSSVPMEET